MVFILIPCWKGIGVGVVEQGMIAITPRELLSPDPQILVGNKIRPDRIDVAISMRHKDVDVCQNNDWDSNKEEEVTPHLPTPVIVGYIGAQDRPGGGETPGQNLGGVETPGQDPGCHFVLLWLL